jgi:DNA-binding protein H-NS
MRFSVIALVMSATLNMAKNQTLQEITAQIEQLQRQAELLRAKHKKPVITAILQAMTQYGITYQELRAAVGGGAVDARARRKVRKVAPKFRNPKTGETWSGRGRTARWIVEAEKEGKSRDKFLIR